MAAVVPPPTQPAPPLQPAAPPSVSGGGGGVGGGAGAPPVSGSVPAPVPQQEEKFEPMEVPLPTAPVAPAAASLPTGPVPVALPVPLPVQSAPSSSSGPALRPLPAHSSPPEPKPLDQLQQQFQRMLDKSTPHIKERWIGFAVLVLVYFLRVFLLRGFYIVTYGLGIYNLNLLIGFLTPQMDMDSDGPSLPTKADQEYKPFVRRLPEFKFWYASSKSFAIGLAMTFFPMFDVPVFWPILLMYWFVLFFVTMKRQIKHMIKYKYIPFSFGKQTYGRSKGAAKNNK